MLSGFTVTMPIAVNVSIYQYAVCQIFCSIVGKTMLNQIQLKLLTKCLCADVCICQQDFESIEDNGRYKM